MDRSYHYVLDGDEANMKEAHCKRPPRGTPKEVLKTLHKSKMMGKFFRGQERGVTHAEREIAKGKHARPNVSTRVLRERMKKDKTNGA